MNILKYKKHLNFVHIIYLKVTRKKVKDLANIAGISSYGSKSLIDELDVARNFFAPLKEKLKNRVLVAHFWGRFDFRNNTGEILF